MVSDKRRREVAARLREIDVDSIGNGYELLEEVANCIGCEGVKYGTSYGQFVVLLADLIEPSERACYYYDAETNHCRCYDTRLVDCDELLALAGDMQDDAAICPHEDCRDHVAVYARRIREALEVDK